MLSRTLTALRVPHTQLRRSSGFNKYPPLKVKPLGLSGNAMLALGASTMVVTLTACVLSGYLVPTVPGMFFSPVGSMKMDLTPDELKDN